MENDFANLVRSVTNELTRLEFYPVCVKAVESKTAFDKSQNPDLREAIKKALAETDYHQKIRNEIYHLLAKNPIIKTPWIPLSNNKEPFDYIRKTQAHWERRICKSLNMMCTELGITLARKRPVSDQKELEARWNQLSTEDPDLTQFRPVYAAKDFLEVLVNLRSSNYQWKNCFGENSSERLIQVPLRVKSCSELIRQFQEICDIELDSEYRFSQAKNKVITGKKIIQKAYAPLAREYCKTGCPQHLRSQIWKLVLGVEVTDKERLKYHQLKSFVFQHDLMVDKLIYKDVKLTACNDDQYFVFEDYLHQVMLLFSRDTNVLCHFMYTSATPPTATLRGKLDLEETTVVYPPNGVIPFHGFSMYIAPLCYVFDDPVLLYFIFREFYTRYFFRLHSLTSHPQGALCLSLLFENLLETVEPQLFSHFVINKIDALRIVFRWLMRAFSGHLPADQVLTLWDIILGFDTLEILAALGVAVLSYRKEALLQVNSQTEIDVVLADMSSLKVIPLFQALFLRMKLSLSE